MGELRFDGRVAIVTGAGGGLGRTHALMLASRGAKVVVNDLGGSFIGEGNSQSAADQVVEEIKAAGGEAIANYDSVEFGDKIVKTAMDAYGRIDVIINNAGILRDISFHKMKQGDWDLVQKVHTFGSFSVTHAAWPIMREQGFGRVIMTASAAGIYGNFGQANYSAAKLGLVGFANTLAIEGYRKNIHVNTIAPIAGSRMTETILPPDLLDALKPEYVSALVVALCHEECEENGSLFEVGGGFYAKLRFERGEGKTFRLGRQISAENIRDNWGDITSFKNTTHPEDAMSSMRPIMENVEAGQSKGGNQFIDVDEALGYEYPNVESSYNEQDLAIYALGIGAVSDPTDDKDLQLVFELHGSGMKAFPTFGVIPGINSVMQLAKEGKAAPGLNFGIERILHGEQKTTVFRPLPTNAKLTNRVRIKNIYDKGKHALLVTEVTSFDQDGNKLISNEITALIRGAGGWDGDRGRSADTHTPPDRAPDKVVEEAIPVNQALLYRLTGDWNPLHIDPGMAQAAGFEKPILQGLCTFGFAGRQVIQTFAKDQNTDYFKSIETRFADIVYPGETLVTEMWKESDTRVIFRCKIKERDTVVISHAAIEFYEEIPKPIEKKKATVKPSPVVSNEPKSEDVFVDISEYIEQSWEAFIGIRDYVERHPELVRSIGFVFLFELTEPDSAWTIDLANDQGGVFEGAVGKADCTLRISEENFLAMSSGASDPMKLFTTGKLKISGNIMASQKLDFLQKIDQKEAKKAVEKVKASGQKDT